MSAPQHPDKVVNPHDAEEAKPPHAPSSTGFVAVSSWNMTTQMPPQDKTSSKPSLEKHSLEKPIMISQQPPQTLLDRSQRYMTAEVSTAHADILFLWCCFISGLVDSTIYNAFGTFVSMQTGNTIFLGLGGATPHDTSKPYGWAKSFVSIGCFCLGCLTFSHATRFFGKLRRVTIVASFLAQTLIIFVAATVVEVGVVVGSLNKITDDIDWWTIIPIALLSFQSAGQIVGSRAVNLSELPTVVLTSMLHDIFTDQKLVARDNVKRNRRVLAFFAILIGAICGGFIGEGTDQMQVPLWIAGGIKFAITLAWAFWPEQKTSAV
ncbi:MAG: hypothetical protein LQ346_001769 [Caloplaca aetnensis]|nr:MAG: hypothetical protein LQ346_001769 [Caloplaca aetnensis]